VVIGRRQGDDVRTTVGIGPGLDVDVAAWYSISAACSTAIILSSVFSNVPVRVKKGEEKQLWEKSAEALGSIIYSPNTEAGAEVPSLRHLGLLRKPRQPCHHQRWCYL